MDEDNFEYELNGFSVKMTGGVLTVAEVIYKAWAGKKRADYAYNDYMR